MAGIVIVLGLGASFCAYFVLIRSASDVALLDSLQHHQGAAADLLFFGAFVNTTHLINNDKNDKEPTEEKSESVETGEWIVLLEVNYGYYDFLLNWLLHFNSLELKNKVVIMALDDTVKKNIEKDLISKHSDQFAVVDSLERYTHIPVTYDSPEFKKLVSGRRASHIFTMLKMGVNVIYSNVDTVWRSSPLPYLTRSISNGTDMIVSVDSKETRGFKPYYSTGFMAIKSNNRTIHFIKEWKRALDGQAQVNQPLFNQLLYNQTNVRHEPFPLDETCRILCANGF